MADFRVFEAEHFIRAGVEFGLPEFADNVLHNQFESSFADLLQRELLHYPVRPREQL